MHFMQMPRKMMSPEELMGETKEVLRHRNTELFLEDITGQISHLEIMLSSGPCPTRAFAKAN